MVDSIKITALQDIGANIAYTTLVPLVNMAGTPTTQKANLQNLGNLILNGAGGSYFARAAQANLALSVANAAQPNITSVGTLTSLAVTGNITAGNINGGNIVVANFYYGDGRFLTNVVANSSYSNSNVANYLPTYAGNVGASNVNVTGTIYANGLSSTGLASLTTVNVAANLGVANIRSAGNLGVTANTLTWNFTDQGVLQWPGGIGQIDTNNSTFEIHSTNGLMISTNEANSSQSFLFDTAGVFTAPGNVNLLGSRLNVGPAAANVTTLLNPTLVIANTGADYIQAAIINSNANGSSDWSADGAGGSDDAAWTDMGFAGFSFNDANFTITEPGDGYLFVQAYANGLGGNMVLATGDHSNTADIIFATGGFLANNEFARIDHANNMFHLTRANSGIRFADGTTQTTAATGNGTYGDSNVVSLLSAFGSNTIVTTGNVTANYFNGVATDVAVESVNNNYSYHMAFVTGAGDTTLHMDNDDNLQYNPADGLMTVNRTDMQYLSVTNSVLTSLVPFDSLPLDLGNATNPWQDLYLSNSTIYLGNATISANGNSIVVDSITVGGNVGTIGNIASINLDGSSSNVLYGNGVFAAVAGGANTGNVTFNDINIIGTGNLKLQPDSANANAYLDIYLTGGPDIHIAGNGETVILGTDDFANVAVNVDGNVSIQAGNVSGTQTWNFGTTGALTLPGGSTIDQTANVSTNINVNGNAWAFGVNGNLTLPGNLVTPNGANAQVGVYAGTAGAPLIISAGIGGTAATSLNAGAGGNLTIKAGDAGSNIGNQSWGEAGGELVLRGGNSTGPYIGGDVAIYSGGSPTTPGAISLYIGANQWTFDATGNLNFPRDVAGNTDPYLNIFGGSTPTIQSTDVSLAGPANLAIQADYLNLSGSTGNRIAIYADNGEIGTEANMVLYTNLANPGNIVSWILDTTGNLTLPDTTSLLANVSITLEANDTGNLTGLSLIGDSNANLYAHGNVTIVSDSSNTTATWTFANTGNLTLPEGGIVTNNIPPVTFDILFQYDDLVWSGNTLTFTNASSGYMLAVLALMQVGDAIILGSTSTTVTGVYTGGGAGTFTVSGTGSGQQIAQFTLPNRLTSVNGIKLTTNAKNYLFTEAGVTQSPVLTVDTLPSGQFAVAGFRAFVSDANLAPVGNFGAIVGNSGSNTVCVWCDGTNWRIG